MILIRSCHIQSESWEYTIKNYVHDENCYQHNIYISDQIGMPMTTQVWTHFTYNMRIIHYLHSKYLVK